MSADEDPAITIARDVFHGLITLDDVPVDQRFAVAGEVAVMEGRRSMHMLDMFAGIDDRGWTVQPVMSSDTKPWFAYTRVHVILADDDGRFPGEPGCQIAEFQMKGL